MCVPFEGHSMGDKGENLKNKSKQETVYFYQCIRGHEWLCVESIHVYQNTWIRTIEERKYRIANSSPIGEGKIRAILSR